MISLTLSVYLSVCLSVCLPTYLSVYQFYLDLSVSVCCSVNDNSSPIELRYEHFVVSSLHLSLCLSFLLVLCLSPFLFPSVLFSLSISLFLFSFSFSLSTYLFTFCVETVTLLKPKRWSFYSSQCSSRFNFYSTVVLSLIKIPTKKAKQDTEKKTTHIPIFSLFPSQ